MAVPVNQMFENIDKMPYPGFVKKLQEVCISAGVESWSWAKTKSNEQPLWLTMKFKDELGFGAGSMEWFFSKFTSRHEIFINAYNWTGSSSKSYARHFQNHLTKHGIPNRHTKLDGCEGVAIPYDYVLECK